MPETYPIHDLYIRMFSPVTEPNIIRWPALSDHDHLLRRFGQAEVVRVLPGHKSMLRVREVADEVWILIEGEIEFIWHDRRRDSPSYDQVHRLKGIQPTLMLVPYGVAFGYRALNGPATLLRLATHADGEHALDQEFPQENGA